MCWDEVGEGVGNFYSPVNVGQTMEGSWVRVQEGRWARCSYREGGRQGEERAGISLHRGKVGERAGGCSGLSLTSGTQTESLRRN